MIIKERIRGYLPVAVRIETSGNNSETDALLSISISIIKMDSNGLFYILDSESINLEPFRGANIDPVVMDKNGIDIDNPFRLAVSEEQGLQEIFSIIKQRIKTEDCTRAIFVGHNAFHDLEFLYAASNRARVKNPFHQFSTIDTVSLSSLRFGETDLKEIAIKSGIGWGDGYLLEEHPIYAVSKIAEIFCLIFNEKRIYTPVDSHDHKLSDEQEAIVNLEDGQHLILAAPGTGKTKILVHRLLRAVKNGIPQEKMACLTFTNRAARNMADRIKSEIDSHNIFVGNIHSYCNLFLRNQGVVKPITSLLNEDDTELQFKELIEEWLQTDSNGFRVDNSPYVINSYNGKQSKITIRELVQYNSYLKQVSFNFSSEILQKIDIKFANPSDERTAKKTCVAYEKIKSETDLIDFDDLLNLTYNYLNTKHSPSPTDPIIQWLEVDEAQDLNPLQWAIINKLSNKEYSHRVFFGDYDQAIFSFMGASLQSLESIASECEKHTLTTNYRSPQYLLSLYGKYTQDILKTSIANVASAEKYVPPADDALQCKVIRGSQHDEIEWIINKISRETLIDSVAILVTTNNTADLFEDKFNELYPKLKPFKISGTDLFGRRIVRDLLSVLSIISNKQNKLAWIRNIRTFGSVTLKQSRLLVNDLFSVGINPLDLLSDSGHFISFLDDFQYLFDNARLVVFDTETTGLDTSNDDIVQIAAIEIIEGKPGRTFEVFINTDKDISESEKIHNISKEYLDEHSVNKKSALSEFLKFIDGDTVVAHNLEYDYDILNSNLFREGLDVVSDEIQLYDSIDITKRLYPNLPKYKLEFLLSTLNIEGDNSHNALDDVRATVNLLTHCVDKIKKTSSHRAVHIDNPTLKKFSESFSPLYKALKEGFSDEISMEDIADSIVFYIDDHVNVQSAKYGEGAFHEFKKLTKHMRLTCDTGISLNNIKKYTPEYQKYKETDLLTDNDQIIISTVHKAKGLEFDTVVIPNCTDNDYPNYYSKTSEAILEGARLLYVAMTRAKRRLIITSSKTKEVNGYPHKQSPSRFLRPIISMFN